MRGRSLRKSRGCARWGKGRRLSVGLGTLLLATWCATTAANGQEEKLLPIQLGPIFFMPSVSVAVRHDDNVERVNHNDPLTGGEIPSFIREFRPELRFEAPFRFSMVQLGYRGVRKEYSAPELQDADGWTHYLSFVGKFQMTPGFRLEVDDHVVDGVTEFLNVIPGGELRYTTRPVRANQGTATMIFDSVGTRSIEVGGTRNASHFDSVSVGSISEFDYLAQGYFGRYVLDTGAAQQLFFSLDYEHVTQSRGNTEQVPSDYRTRSAGIGFRRQMTPGQGSELKVGYGDTRFVNGTGTPLRGVTLEGTLYLQPGVTSKVQVKLRRDPQVSFFNVNGYYLNGMVMIDYHQELGRSLALEVLTLYNHNSYPEPVDSSVDAGLTPSEGVKRKDNLYQIIAGLAWRLGRTATFNLAYRLEEARSNIVAQALQDETLIHYKIYDYDSHSVQLSVAFGWQ